MDIEKFENSPVRESMNSQSRGKGWDMKQYYNGSNNRRIIGRYLRRYLKKSIGKSYNDVRKHVLEKFKDVHARHESNVADAILNLYVGKKDYHDYIVDEQGRLQMNQTKINRDNYWANYKRLKKRTVSSGESKTYRIKENLSTEDAIKLRTILMSKIHLTRKQIEHIMYKGIVSEILYKILIDSNNRYYLFTRKLTTEESAFVANCFDIVSGVDYVIKDNFEYRKYKKESLDQARKKHREKIKFESEMRNEELSEALIQDKRKRRIQKSKVKWPDVYLDE